MRTFAKFKAAIEKDLEELAHLDVAGAAEAIVRVRRGTHDLLLQDAIGSNDRETSELIIQRGDYQRTKEITWD